jgi:two-component system LytT family sensor kinase
MFSTKYRYLFIVILAAYSYANTLFSEVYNYYHINVEWYWVLLLFILITGFVWEGNRWLQFFLKKYLKEISYTRFLITFFLWGVVISALLSAILVLLLNALFIHLATSELKLPLKLAFTYGTRVNLFLHIINAILFYISRYKDKQVEAEELRRINSQAELEAIKSQVNPHFLFNNMNVLSSLVMQESPDANKFIEEFSKVYRHVLNSQQRELITLKEELEFITPYIFLLQKRFPESIFINIDVAPEYLSYFIIPVAVQMLVENAIKHNITSRQKPLHIFLSVTGKKNLTVANNLQLKPVTTESSHIGLQNIAKRYELITGKTIDIEKTSENFSVSLPLIEPEYENGHY